MKVLAVYNIKGGVGKTTATVNLAYHASRSGARVLVWDLDPQSAATFYFRVQAHVDGGGKRLMRGKTELASLVRGTDHPGLDLVPADFSYRHMDRVLGDQNGSRTRLAELLAPLASRYDCVFFDCPPSISMVSENVFHAADALLVPMIPTTLSLRTLNQLEAFRSERDGLQKLQVYPFLSMVDRRKRLHAELETRLAQERSDFLRASVPYASDAEKMGIQRAPIATYAPRSVVAGAFDALWQEIQGRLYDTRPAASVMPVQTAQRPCVICGFGLQPAARGWACGNCGYHDE